MDIDDAHIGRRFREIRTWRGLSMTAAAGLAGISQPYLSQIERGQRLVTKRSLLESLANALQVSPAELTAKPWETVGEQAGTQTSVDLVALAAALDAYQLGDDPGDPVRPWPEVAADVERVADHTQLHGEEQVLREQGKCLPKLLGELHGLYVRDPARRREVLHGLLLCYRAAVSVTKLLAGGSSGFTSIAAKAAQQCADELESPQWRGAMTWLRGHAVGSLDRTHQYRRAVRMADELTPSLDDPEVVQAYGQLHLSAALAAAAQSDRETAMTHLDEAGVVAGRVREDVGRFAKMWFGRTNVAIWRVSIGLELGDGAGVARIARGVRPENIPSPARQSAFYADVGRALLAERSTWEKGLELLLRAEKLAPQHIRHNVFVREAVAGHLRAMRRDAGGRELRGLAFRMGVAPNG